MRRTRLVYAVATILVTAQTAQATGLHYVAYAAGLRVLEIAVEVDLSPRDYRIAVDLHTTGLFSAVVSGRTTTEVEGGWAGLAATPRRYDSRGTWRGRAMRALIDYVADQPVVRDLQPDPDPDHRDAVPQELRAGTVDTLSAMAALVRQLVAGHGCDAHARLFDGRRLSEVASHTVGTETLEATSRSIFQGPALRCDFEGRLLAGFPSDEDHERAARPHGGSAWFAPLSPDGPPLPVRIVFETRFFGHATMYLTSP